MEKLKDRKIALTMELEGLNKAKNKSRSDAELQKQVENMRNEIVAIKEERPPLAKRLKDLEDELKRRKEKPKPKDSVKVQPRGVLGGGADVIFFVECNSTGIVLLDSQGWAEEDLYGRN
jgi:septal ring factor EnvC (AmiA/AmiB activator)